jgi:CheY-like chemotaxis protein
VYPEPILALCLARSEIMDRPYTVLLVERAKPVRRLTKRLLRRLGFDVMEVSDAPAALEVLANDGRHVDLVLIGAVGLDLR